MVERFSRTLKGKMWKYFTANNTLKYIDVLQKLVRSYNHSRHRSIGMRPSDVNLKNESVVWERLYGDEANKLFKYKFSVGDQVRISKARRTGLPTQLDRRSIHDHKADTKKTPCV